MVAKSTNHSSGNHSHKKVKQVDLSKTNSVDSLIRQMSGAGVFGGGRLAKAIDILELAEINNAQIYVGLAGAMIPGGMREVISQAIREDRIHCLVSTGANITHDLIESFGGHHIRDINYESDTELHNRGIDRIYDAFVENESFTIFEDNIKQILQKLWEKKAVNNHLIIKPSELMKDIGSFIKDENSIVKAAFDKKIPIFIPGISDSILGLQIWLFSQFNSFTIDTIGDIGVIQELVYSASSACAFILGGGVPKNYIFQAALITTKHYDYAVQITMDRVETGGLSGATLNEAISWGKIEPDAKTITVVSDLTIALPLIYASLRQRRLLRFKDN